MKPTKIAIVCQNDTLWSLYAWNKALPLLKNNSEFEITGFWVCHEKFMNVPKNEVVKWYLKVFGLFNVIMLALFKIIFSTITTFKTLNSKYKTSFKSLLQSNQIPCFSIASPNDKELTEWIKKNEIEVLVIMVGHILKSNILTAPTNCIINKHAALLPSNKGVFPYFWAFVKNEAQGISFHKVTGKIDEGDVLYQERVEAKQVLSSMIAFYFYTYKNYGEMLLNALKNAKTNSIIKPDLSINSSYHSGPTTADFKEFSANGGRIINISDLFLPFSL